MKQFSIWAAVAAIMFIGSCTAEPQPQQQETKPEVSQEPQVPQVETRELVITAYSSDGSSTKSSRGEDGTFYWSKGDEISVFYGSGTQGGARFQSTITTDREEISDFSGTIETSGDATHEYWGIYPYNVLNEWNETTQTLSTEIPSHQTAAEGTFADGQFISIGHSNELSMGFYHLCGGIKFKLGAENANVTQITLRGNNNEVLAGVVEVTVDEQNHPVVSRVVKPQYEIILTPPANTQYFVPGAEYYFVTKPVEFQQGFTVTFETANTVGKRIVNSSMTVNRAKFQWSNSTIDTGASFIQLDKPDPNIVPSAVQSFIQDANELYPSDNSYTKSAVRDYSGSDKPEPVSITWNGSGATLVQVSTSPSFDEVLGQNNIQLSTSSAKIYNLIPNVVYYYRVYAESTLLKEGCLRPVGPLRMVYGVTDNVRDLGGWLGENGKTIRYGKLYRGANIDNITDGDHETNKDIFLNTLNIGLLMDLRGYVGSSTEGPSNPFEGSGTQMDYSIYRVWKYLGFGTKDGRDAELPYEYLYRDAIKRIISYLSENGEGIYFHCSAGSDRTGTLAFLIEALLGVSECDMSIDYELTSYSYYKDSRQERRRNATGSYPYKTFVSHLKSTYNKGTMQKNVEAWAKDGDSPLTDADIAQLKALLLE